MPKFHDTGSRKIKDDLKQAGARPRKKLGQNFLINRSVADKIIAAAGLTTADTVIEVGPGLGALTGELAKNAGRVIAVERDHKLFLSLQDRLKPYNNLRIVRGDILKLDLAQLIGGSLEYKVIANLPYNITSPVLYYFMQAALRPCRMVIMLQKEVAESILASDGRLSLLAVGLRIHSVPALVAHVPREDFYPAPKVDSAVLKLDFMAQPLVPPAEQDAFIEIARSGFRAPRKHLRNSLAMGMGIKTADAEALLREARLDPQLRPENVTMEGWLNLYAVMKIQRIVKHDD